MTAQRAFDTFCFALRCAPCPKHLSFYEILHARLVADGDRVTQHRGTLAVDIQSWLDL